jgi:hypothetical protein
VAQPDRFSLTTIHKFPHRMRCWIFRATFEEKVLDIMSVLEIIKSVKRSIICGDEHTFSRCNTSQPGTGVPSRNFLARALMAHSPNVRPALNVANVRILEDSSRVCLYMEPPRLCPFALNVCTCVDPVHVCGSGARVWIRCTAIRTHRTTRCATQELVDNDNIREVLQCVLAVGNHMNGGTRRGQADGFNIEFLTKLRDVKTRDNKSTLIRCVTTRGSLHGVLSTDSLVWCLAHVRRTVFAHCAWHWTRRT